MWIYLKNLHSLQILTFEIYSFAIFTLQKLPQSIIVPSLWHTSWHTRNPLSIGISGHLCQCAILFLPTLLQIITFPLPQQHLEKFLLIPKIRGTLAHTETTYLISISYNRKFVPWTVPSCAKNTPSFYHFHLFFPLFHVAPTPQNTRLPPPRF